MTKFTKTREFFIPKAARIVHRDDRLQGVVYAYETAGRLYGLAFSGKRNKPDWHYRFQSDERLAARIVEWLTGLRQSTELRAKRREELKAPHTLKVGDVLRSSWGYDQTNIDYYQVTKLVGSRMVEIRELCQISKETSYMQGECAPIVGKFTKLAPMRRVARENYVKIESWGRYARKLEPTVVAGVPTYGMSHWTSYA